MTNNSYPDEVPNAEEEMDKPKAQSGGDAARESRLSLIWVRLSHAGLGETIYRLGTAFLTIALILLAVVGMRWFYLHFQQADPNQPREAALAAEASTPTPTAIPAIMPAFAAAQPAYQFGITRLAMLHTSIPSRPRTEIITYTVQKGDTVFGIAEIFGLKPETILWGNYYTLADNPELISEGQVLNIMPMNGTYHRWSEGEGLNGVAHGYNMTADVIVNWPGNHLDPATLGDYSHPNIDPGTMLFVPGG
ncbi:MAG TPA: LysM domain-containing protein, partial [Anaerolineales bacterium]